MEKLKASENIPSSFRDPSGFLFHRGSSIYRQINLNYSENYDHLMNSGLYETLVNAGLLIPHEELDIEPANAEGVYKVIRPEPISFISYPYEWSFSQLKNAALATLEIQKKSLHFGMSLKDCSAYNIQFRKGRPIFIDTLSFEKYREGEPWVAYRQFCQHFLAPLALMGYKDIRLNQLFRIYIDGLPLDLASSFLPFSTRFVPHLLFHIHLHSRSQRYFVDKTVNIGKCKMSRLSYLGLLDNLASAVKKLKWRCNGNNNHWANYYEDTNYSQVALRHKQELVAGFLEEVDLKSVWDIGANTGLFSRIASDKGIPTISFDIDPAAIEKSYLECIKKGETNILPLLLDLTNPSPGIGWQNRERMSLSERGPADMVFALALIHHLRVSDNLPFNKIAEFFGNICNFLIIEFVPKGDTQVQRLLSTREDIFPDYTRQAFESEFGKYFAIQNRAEIKNSGRTLYLMQKNKSQVL